MRTKTSTILFWVFLVMPALISAIIAAVPRNSADPLVGLSLLIWIVSSLYCGIWIGVKLSQSSGIRVLLSFLFVSGILAINCCILAAGCSGKIDFR